MIGWFLFKRFKSFKADPTTSNIAQLGVQNNGSNRFDLRIVFADTFTPVLNTYPYLCFHSLFVKLNSISVTYNFIANGDWGKQRNYDGENVSLLLVQ